ncbi:MAG TPA: PQQ-dependent sugar dehydrogenase [Sphingomicrobium sp.]|nr:PQQ-dependent sugar dehydrogenase [Sphingomicrobium sp.]
MQSAIMLILAACGSPARTSGQDSAGPANLPASETPFHAATIATFDNPWAMAFLPGTNLALVTEQPGRIWLVDAGTGRKQPVSGAPGVVYRGQGGLLDVVAAPGFEADRLIYLTYSEASRNGGSGLALARARLVRNGGGARLEDLEVLWRDPAGGEGGQFGAVVVFAPDGKSLFLTTGDRQRFTPAQDPNQPLGKILHLTLEGKPAPGNPGAGRTGASSVTITDPPKDSEAAKNAPGRSVRWPGVNLTPAETWSSGHRNPYGLAFAPDGRLWETEMGPRGGDELNLILPGRNYGWPLVSEGRNYDGVPIPKHSSRPDIEPPKLYWAPSVSPTSLLIYSGKLFPGWKGDGLIGALSGKALIHVRIRGEKASKVEQWDMGARIRFVGEGPEGAVYLLEDGEGARMLRLTPPQSRR